ncbi:hypothetical protein [Lachnospira multipara]|uniref:hypothetical protein n=1 Tax=Lachnospira multipara TaxID=28051 RepID=UPI0004863247|nr:hypothetical protein [Lachnospira multipara]
MKNKYEYMFEFKKLHMLVSDDLLDIAYNGQDVKLEYDKYVLFIKEGSGDNLSYEDIEDGYVDYIYTEVYLKDDLVKEEFPSEVGGGFMLLKDTIENLFYDKPIRELIDYVFTENTEEDYYELHTTSLPSNAILTIES